MKEARMESVVNTGDVIRVEIPGSPKDCSQRREGADRFISEERDAWEERLSDLMRIGSPPSP